MGAYAPLFVAMHKFIYVFDLRCALRETYMCYSSVSIVTGAGWPRFFLIFIAQKVSNIHLVTKDFKIVPLTNLLKLLIAGRVIGGGGDVLLGLY